MAISEYPTRIVTLEIEDFGLSDGEGSTHCPHCFANGRYVHHFLCDDGKIHSAMSGCIKLFPSKKSALSTMAELALAKQKDLKEGQKLASWYQSIINTLEHVKNGNLTIEQAEKIAQEQQYNKDNWLKQNGYGKYRR